MCILLCKSTRYDLTGYISLVIKLNILNHIMILASTDYSYSCILNVKLILDNYLILLEKETPFVAMPYFLEMVNQRVMLLSLNQLSLLLP